MWDVGGLTDLCDVMLRQKRLQKSCRMGRRNVVMELLCSLPVITRMDQELYV